MTIDDLKQAAHRWCDTAEALHADARGGAMLVRVKADDESVTVIELTGPREGGTRFDLEHEFTLVHADIEALPGRSPEARRDMLLRELRLMFLQRGGLLRVSLTPRGNDIHLRFVHPLYADGLSQHAFVGGVVEVARARELLSQLIHSWRAQQEEWARMQEELQQGAPQDSS